MLSRVARTLPADRKAGSETETAPLSAFEIVEKYDEKKVVKPTMTLSTLRQMYPRLTLVKPHIKGKMRSSAPGFCAEIRCTYGGAVSVNSAANKYLQFLNGTTTQTWASILGSMDELANLQNMFNEVFVRRITLRYIPVNKFSSNSTASSNAAGSPGDLNTCAASICFLPHNQVAYVDQSSAWYQARVEIQSKTVNMAEEWSLKATNPDKFSWTDPVLDQTTSGSTMGWCSLANVSLYGGRFQLITPFPSGAAVGLGDLLESGTFGTEILEVDCCVRARI